MYRNWKETDIYLRSNSTQHNIAKVAELIDTTVYCNERVA